jgi:hypothetical protein
MAFWTVFRVVLVVTWVQILGVILVPYQFKLGPILGVAYRWLRVITILAVPVLLYKARKVSAKRSPVVGVLTDTLLPIPMYLLWCLIWLFSSAPISQDLSRLTG